MTRTRLVALLFPVALLFAGCGGGSGDDGETDATDVAAHDGAGDAADDAAPPDADVAPPADVIADDAVAADVAAPLTLACTLVLRDGERALDGPVDLTLADEPAAYAATPGFQVDFRVDATGLTADARALLRVDGQLVGDEPVSTDGSGVASTRVDGVTLPHAPTGIPAALELQQGGAVVATCLATLRIDLGPCPVELEPTADACLLNDEDMAPGFQRRFVIRSAGGGCDRAALVYQVGGTSLMLPAVPLDETDAAEFVLTLFPSTAALDNEAVLVTGLASDSANPGREAQTTPRVFTVDTSAPRVEVAAPAGPTVTMEEDDDDNPANGLQLVVRGRAPGLVPGDGMALSLSVDGRTERTTDVAEDATFAFSPFSFTSPGTHQFEVIAVDTCGQRGEWSATVDVFPLVPDVAILAPADGMALWSRDDGDPTTLLTYETSFTVQAAGIREGTTLTVRCRRDALDAPLLAVGDFLVDTRSADDRYEISVALRVDLQGADQLCRVATDGPNPATSGAVNLWVALPAPRLTLLSPADEAVLGGDAVVVTGTAVSLAGRPLELHLDDEAGVPVVVTISPTPVLGGTFGGTIPLALAGQPIADGRYRVWVDATDTLGNVASDQTTSDVDAWIRLDRSAPGLSFDWPPPEGLNPTTNPEAADSAPERPGYQNDVRVRVSGEPFAAGTEVCLSRDGAPLGCATLAGDEDVAVFADVTFQPGANSLVASATDATGNPSTTAPYPVEVVFDAPRVVFDEPPAGLVTAQPLVSAVVRVTGDAGAIDGAAVSLYVNDDALAAVPEALGGGRYRFANVPLAPGPNVLEARATAGGSEGSTGPHLVTYKIDGPSIAFEAPIADEVLNLAAAACSAGQADCALTVRLAASNLEDGAAATLTIDCGVGAEVFESHAGVGAVLFEGVVLPNGTTCTLAASATDVVGQAAEAGPITVRIDRTAPVISAIDLPDVLQAGADERPEEPGMQVTLTVLLEGAEAGQRLSVRVENSVGEGFDYGVDLPSTIADGAVTPVTVGVVTLPEDFVEVTADIADVAGNPAETGRKSLYVNSDTPDVRLLQPDRIPNDPCTTNDDCVSGGVCGPQGCGNPWSAASTFEVQVGLQGIAIAENTLRVCSDHPDLVAAPACANGEGAFHELVRADVTGDVSEISLETVIPEGFQTIIAEAEALPGTGDWVSSVDNPIQLYRRRFLYVDTQPPVLVALGSPSDTEAPAGVLNAAEQTAPGRHYAIQLTASEDGLASLWVNGTEDGVAPVVGGVAVVDATLLEGENQIQARLADFVGNLSALGPVPAFLPFVDTTPPTLAFVTPDRSPLLAGDARDVTLQSNAIGQTVTVHDGVPPVAVATADVAGDGSAAFPHAAFGILADGTHQLTATVVDTAGNPRTATTSPGVVEVDTVPPLVTVAAPEVGRVFVDSDDVGPAMGGFQILVRFTPSGATTWSLDLASGCDLAFANCDAPVAKGSGSASDGEVGRTLTVPVDGATTYHVLGFEVRDALGNTTRATVPFSLALVQCVVSVDGLPASGVYNNNACVANPGRDCDSVDDTLGVSVSISCVGTDAIALFKDGVEFARTTDLAPDGSGTFDVTFAHAEAFELSARALAGSVVVGDSGGLPLRVDLHDPVPAFVTAVVDGFTTAASGERPQYGIADDQQPGTPGTIEIHARLTATDDVALAGGRVASFYRTTDGVSVPAVPTNVTIPITIVDEPWSVDFKNLSLPHGGPHTLRVTVADAAGNTATTAFVPTANAQAPAAVVLDPIADADVNPRQPAITLRWLAPADDGSAGNAVAGYDIRFSNLPITNDVQFEAACPADELVPGLPVPAPGAPGTPETFTLQGPDARSPLDPCRFVTSLTPQTIYVAVKAIDEAGNASLLGPSSVRSTSAAQLRVAALTHQDVAVDPANEGDVDYWTWSVGDLNGDDIDDMAIGGFWASSLCVVYGHADAPDGTFDDYLLDGLTGPNHVCIADTGLTYLGYTTSHRVDVNGDGIDDLVLGLGSRFPAWPRNEEVRIYLGRDGAPLSTTPNVRVVGMQTFQFTGLVVDSAGNFNGDTSGGRPVEDIAIASDYEGPAGLETGAVYVVPGNASWNAATSLLIDVSVPAERATHNVARIALQGAVPVYDDSARYVPPLFGYRVARAGNILTDAGQTQYDDLLITQRIHKRAVYLVKGRPLTGGATILITDGATVPNPPTGEDAQIVRLQPEFSVSLTNFGDTLLGGVDLDGGGVPDVIVTHPINAPGNNIHVFWGERLQGRVGQLTTRVSLASPPETVGEDVLRGANGVIIPGSHQRPTLLGDFDGGGGTVDLAYGVKGVTDFGEVFVRLNLGLPAVSGALGVFPFEDLILEDPTGAGSLCFGSTLAGPGDVNGDGLPDLLVGGGGCGTVWLVY